MEEIISKNQLYYYKNRDTILAKAKEYRENNKEKIVEWKEKNKDSIREYNKKYLKEYYQNNKERHRERDKVWKKNHIEQERERKRKWKKDNPEKAAASWRKRKAIKLGVTGGHFTAQEFADLCNKTGNKCLCCGRTDVKLTADHVAPISLGLPHSDEISNIQPLCVPCNSIKHTKIVDYR